MSNSKPFYDPVRKEVHGPKPSGLLTDTRGLGCFVLDAMKKWAKENKIAQIIAETGYEDPYKSLLSRCVRTAIAMRELGIQKNDIITICSNHHLNSVVPLIAASFLGAITAPTDPSLSLDETKHLLNLVKPKLVFASPNCVELIANSLDKTDFKCELIVFGNDKNSKYKTFDWFLQERSDENSFEPVVVEDLLSTCLILFSSGTTGLPKGICLTHKLVMKSISGMTSLKTPVKTFLGYASLYWVSAVIIGISSLGIGARRLLCQSFKPELVCDIIAKYQVDYLFIATVQAIQSIPFLNDNGNRVKYMMVSGSKIAPCYLEKLREKLPDAFIAGLYGQTEVGYITQLTEKDHNYSKLESCGLPMAGLTIKIVDLDTEENLPLGKVGEIRVKTDCGLNGYYRQDSSGVWDSEGYIMTGDLGYFDNDLCLFVTDRIKEMFKYMSWHIVPAELEATLQTHPDVDLAIVIGIPHPADDNHALGIVTLQPNANVTAKQIEQYVNDRVNDRHKLRAGDRKSVV